jgi:uncharacterized protein YndB with AHSA1/START domain
MKWLLAAIAAVLALVVAVLVIGALLPREHTAAVRATYAQPPEAVYDVIADVGASASWRAGVDSVRVMDGIDSVRWTEYSSFGGMTMVHERAERPRLVVARIADESEGFGGTWTYELVPAAAGTRLTITERGVVYNPIFRFVSKYVFGHYRSLEAYARDLGSLFGEAVDVSRVE